MHAGAGEDGAGAAHAASLRRAAAEAAEAVGEDHTSAAWRAQRKHMFVLTNAGAPSRPGVRSRPAAEQARKKSATRSGLKPCMRQWQGARCLGFRSRVGLKLNHAPTAGRPVF